jgi:6-pyruvoyltetrahydropterin/6-carboxytetrahydropterin synthase
MMLLNVFRRDIVTGEEDMKTSATRRIEWDAAHRVMRHESKCATLHGHRYVAEVTVEADQLDPIGRVIDFGKVKEIVGDWVDKNWDHTTLINCEDALLLGAFANAHAPTAARKYRPPFLFDGEPTAENIAKVLLEKAAKLLLPTYPELVVTKVRVYETPNCYAEVSR